MLGLVILVALIALSVYAWKKGWFAKAQSEINSINPTGPTGGTGTSAK